MTENDSLIKQIAFTHDGAKQLIWAALSLGFDLGRVAATPEKKRTPADKRMLAEYIEYDSNFDMYDFHENAAEAVIKVSLQEGLT